MIPLNYGRNEPSIDTNSSHRVTVEDVEDEDDPRYFQRYVEPYPSNNPPPQKRGTTKFEQWQRESKQEGCTPLDPFKSEEEWGLASWLMRNIGKTNIDEYLKLDIVCLAYPNC